MSAQKFYTLDDLRRWDDIVPTLDTPAVLAVIGDPIAHSRSPQMMNPALAARGIRGQYIRVQVPPGSVKEALRLFAQHKFVGVNCTIPHKFEALEAVDEVDPLAQKLGAVNTVLIRDGKLEGFNSDGPGFLNSVHEVFGKEVRDLRVLVIGAGGGAGRAVAVQCALENCRELFLVNRSLNRQGETLFDCIELNPLMPIRSGPMAFNIFRDELPRFDLIINATPLGMKPDDKPPFDLTLLRPSHLIFDMVYRANGITPFTAAAKAIGAKVCDGLTLLLHQGAISFGHWFGEPVPLEAMRGGLMLQ